MKHRRQLRDDSMDHFGWIFWKLLKGVGVISDPKNMSRERIMRFYYMWQERITRDDSVNFTVKLARLAKSRLRCSCISQLQICNISWNQICISFEYLMHFWFVANWFKIWPSGHVTCIAFPKLCHSQTGSKFGHQVTSGDVTCIAWFQSWPPGCVTCIAK